MHTTSLESAVRCDLGASAGLRTNAPAKSFRGISPMLMAEWIVPPVCECQGR